MIQRVRKNERQESAGNRLPTSRNFEIPQKFQDILLHDSGVNDPNRILAFGNMEMLEYFMVPGCTGFGDGTFQICPTLFFQLYTLHTRVAGYYPPCVYFLLPNKTEATYNRMLAIFRQLALRIDPLEFLVDFELAAMNAFRRAFPEADVTGCFFHLSQ